MTARSVTATARRACIGCRGEGWTDAGLVDDWPTLAPCPECRPITAALAAGGAYRADAPLVRDSDRLEGIADMARAKATDPRTALWPADQLREAPPGHRLTGPTPKATTHERTHP